MSRTMSSLVIPSDQRISMADVRKEIKAGIDAQMEMVPVIGTCPLRGVPFRIRRSELGKWQQIELEIHQRLRSSRREDRIYGECAFDGSVPVAEVLNLSTVATVLTHFDVYHSRRVGDTIQGRISILGTPAGRLLASWLEARALESYALGVRYWNDLKGPQIIAVDVVPGGLPDPNQDDTVYYEDWLEYHNLRNNHEDLWGLGKFTAP